METSELYENDAEKGDDFELDNAQMIQDLADRLNLLSEQNILDENGKTKKVDPYSLSGQKGKQFRKLSNSGTIEESWKIEEEEVSPSPLVKGRLLGEHVKKVKLFVRFFFI